VNPYPRRPTDARKGDFGHVLVVGGSPVFHGCLVFNAKGALAAGADLVTVAAPRRAADLAACGNPDLITVPFEASHPDAAARRAVLALADRFDAAVVGAGVERTPAAHRGILALVAALEVPLVLDAEALRALAKDPGAIAGRRALLTPHGGEFEALAGDRVADRPLAARKEAVRRAARRLHATVLLKGARDVVSDGRRVAVDPYGSPLMTKGGWGDLLAGVAGALLARGLAPFDAGRHAAAIVGRAGERAGRALGEGAVVSRALDEVPRAIGDLFQRKGTGRKRKT